MDLFSVTCTTCQAKLKVRSASAIGQIFNCPKCQSMVQIVPPPDWQPPPDAGRAKTPAPVPPSAAPAAKELPVATESAASLPSELTESPPPAATAPVPPPLPAVSPAPEANWTSPTEQATQRLVVTIASGGFAALVGAALALWALSGDDAPAPPIEQVAAAPREEQAPPPAVPAEEKPADEQPTVLPPLSAPPAPAKAVDASEKTEPAEPAPVEPQAAAPEPQPLQAESPPAPQEPAASPATTPMEAAQRPGRPSPFPSFVAPLEQVDPQAAISNAVNLSPLPEGSEPAAEQDGTDPAAGEVEQPVETPVVRRLPPDDGQPPLDMAARLREKVRQIELRAMPLVEFARLVSKLTMLPISLDVPALTAGGHSLQTPLSVQGEQLSVAELLARALGERGLTYRTEQDQLVITTAATPRDVLLRVEDLVGEDLRQTQEFARLVQQLVAPDSWQAAGGSGTVAVKPGELTVRTDPAVLYELVIFCERLRVARDLAPRSRLNPRQFALDTQPLDSVAALSRPVTFTFHEPTRLQDVTRLLESQTGLTLLIDWRSLAHDEFLPTTEITCAIHQRPLAEALTAVLAPLNLAWRVVDDGTLEIHSRHGNAAKSGRAFYSLRRLVDAGVEPESILAAVRRDTADDLWQAGGGFGVLHYDPPSQYLIVLQTQAVQREVAAALRALGQKLAAGR